MLDIRSKAVTIDNCSSLFATICPCSPLFALFALFGTIPYSWLFAIRVFQTPIQLLLNIVNIIKSRIMGFNESPPAPKRDRKILYSLDISSLLWVLFQRNYLGRLLHKKYSIHLYTSGSRSYSMEEYYWFICSSIRNWIAYAYFLWNKYCKQGFPYRLSYLDKPEDDDFNHNSHVGRHITVSYWSPVSRLQGFRHSRPHSPFLIS